MHPAALEPAARTLSHPDADSLLFVLAARVAYVAVAERRIGPLPEQDRGAEMTRDLAPVERAARSLDRHSHVLPDANPAAPEHGIRPARHPHAAQGALETAVAGDVAVLHEAPRAVREGDADRPGVVDAAGQHRDLAVAED